MSACMVTSVSARAAAAMPIVELLHLYGGIGVGDGCGGDARSEQLGLQIR